MRHINYHGQKATVTNKNQLHFYLRFLTSTSSFGFCSLNRNIMIPFLWMVQQDKYTNVELPVSHCTV